MPPAWVQEKDAVRELFLHVGTVRKIRLVLAEREKKKAHLGFVLENRLGEAIIIQMRCQNPWGWNLLHPL